MTHILAIALVDVCGELEKFDPQNSALRFARGVLAAKPVGKKCGSRQKDATPEMIDAYESGLSLVEVAAMAECAVRTARSMLVAHGVKIRKKGPPTLGPDARLEKILEMRDCGASGEEIGAALGITRERVRQIILKAGLKAEFAPRPYTVEQKNALDSYASGKSLRLCAAQFGVQTTTFKQHLIKNGIPIRPSAKKMRWKEARLQKAKQVARLYQEGVLPKDIAVAMGFKHATRVYSELALAGVEANASSMGKILS